MTDTITVVIADDHGLVRRGTRDILEQEPSIEVVGEVSSGAELIELVDATRPNVALVDVGMPGMSGIEALRRIREAWPEVAVLVLTIHEDSEYVWRAVESGASGYLVKDVSDRDLIDAVLTVGRGGTALAPSMVAGLVGRLRDDHRSSEGEVALTAREQEVLERVARGYSNKAIAEALDVSPRTVEVHLTHVYKKLGADSRTKAVAIATRRGLVTVDDAAS